MNDTTNKTNYNKEEFDYIFILFKNWKTIFLASFVFLLVGLSSFLFSSKTHSAEATFAITLKKEINTAYGKFDLKTQNPLHYLSFIELNQFKDSVLIELGEPIEQYIDFKIEAESTHSSDNFPTAYPNKFDLIVKGEDKKKLVEYSTKAIKLLLDIIDEKVQKEMMNYFSSDLSIQIEDLVFDIGVKKDFIEILKIRGDNNIDLKDDEVDIGNYADDRLLNRLEGGEKGLIISILLNKEKGSTYYQEAILAIEEMQLKVLNNDLYRSTQLLNNLIKKDKEGALDDIFNEPFSRDFIMLTPSEVQADIDFGKYVKRTLIFLFFGFFISSSVVLVKTYYKQKFKTA